MRAKDFRKLSREKLNGKWKRLIGIMLVAGLLGGWAKTKLPTLDLPLRLFDLYRYGRLMRPITLVMTAIATLFPVVGDAVYRLFLGAWMHMGMMRLGLDVLDGDAPGIRKLFHKEYYGKALRLHFVRSLLVGLWSLLLLVPGWIAAYRYAMADYILICNPEMGVVDALRESKKRMYGRKWKLFCLELSFIGWAMLYCVPGCLLIANAKPAALSGVVQNFSWMIVLGWILIWLGWGILNPYICAARAAFFRHDPKAE